ncbi:MAG: hypothetical protein IPF66_17645 [Holophagales bacterium]|nr:hypothetical protein [Holophagales bacterium]
MGRVSGPRGREPVAGPQPAAAPAPKAPTGRLAVSFLSPSERVEEPLVVTLTPALPAEMPGSRAAEIERRLVLARRPERSRAVFEGLAPGRWVLAWSGPGVSSDERGVTLSAGPTLSVDVALRGGRSLAGSVRDDLGMVVAGAEVVVRTAAGPFDGTPRPWITAKSGGDGGFKLVGLPSSRSTDSTDGTGTSSCAHADTSRHGGSSRPSPPSGSLASSTSAR